MLREVLRQLAEMRNPCVPQVTENEENMKATIEHAVRTTVREELRPLLGADPSDRAAWANALKDGINRAKTGAPTAGWLFKEGGRKSGLSFIGWKRRWFVLPPPGNPDNIELKYYESPSSAASSAT